jgi:hypothetical protein
MALLERSPCQNEALCVINGKKRQRYSAFSSHLLVQAPKSFISFSNLKLREGEDPVLIPVEEHEDLLELGHLQIVGSWLQLFLTLLDILVF